jgi:tetratricopeptide (TPR) repeat protein
MSAVPERAKSVFLKAVEAASDEERRAFLDAACRGDDALRREVHGLLAHHGQLGAFLESPPAGLAGTGGFAPGGAPSGPGDGHAGTAEGVGATVGPYQLVQEIGEGGMGTVFLAQQTEPVRRLVALKVVKPGMDSRQVVARFEAERQALALMDHPHIAKVLDGGATAGGRPYFVMELVKGVPITRYCDEHRLTPRQRLELFIPVCQAVQHAHQKGVIHRDLKPSNVLVALYDGKPVPKVIDFGVAKAAGQPLTERTLVTGLGAVVGTLEYMSPEQAELNQLDIDTRSDIYSLGVLLYELLTGTTPLGGKRLQGAALLDVLRRIREEEPPRPSTRLSTTEGLPSVAANRGLGPKQLSGLVRGELDWIVMKALEKDRNRRYETANGFAADVQRYLADEPVLACPPSAWYRFRKFARRNNGKLAAVAGASLAVALTAATIGWAVRDRAAREAEIGRQEEKRREGVAQQAAGALAEAQELCRADRLPEARAAVKRAEELLAGGGSDELRARLSQVRHDVKMAGRVEETRLQRAAVQDGHFDTAGADRAYGEAFRDYGLDVAALAPDQPAERIRASAIREQLVAALDDWLEVKASTGRPGGERVLAVAQRADTDRWRRQLREASWRRDAKALKELAAGPQVSAQPPATVVLLGSALRGVDAAPLAIAVLRSAQQRHPNDFWLNHDLAFALANSRPAEPGLAVGYYRAALALRPESPGVCVNLGKALGENGEQAEAVAAFQRAIALKRDYAEAHYNLGNALAARGHLDEAIAEYREALRLKPELAEAHCNLGNFLARKGQLDEAIAECREALRLKKDFADAHCNLGFTLAARGQLDEAIAEYREALRLKKDSPVAHNNLGLALAYKGRAEEAIAEYRGALRLKKDYADAHYNLGNALEARGQLDEAVAEYREALRLKKDFAEAHCALGVALADKGRLDEAVAEFRGALRLKKDYADAHCNLGAALKARGQLEEAIAEYREALRLKKDNPVAHNNLGVALADKGRLDEAVAECREALRLKKDYADAHFNLGNALYAKGRLDEAIEAYREAIRLKEDHAGAHCNLGQALRQQGDFRRALAELRRGRELGSKDRHWPYLSASAQWVRECERLIDLEGRLPGFLEGKTAPASPAERIELAELCTLKRLHRAAARLYEGAFAADPKLLDDLGAAHRYNAACAAALAGCGQGQDADQLDGKERARLRRQALDWLRADLEAWGRLLDRGPDNVRPRIVEQLRRWLADTDFTGVRGPAALARLPEAERPAWQKLWGDVAETLARVQTKAPPGKKSGAQ